MNTRKKLLTLLSVSSLGFLSLQTNAASTGTISTTAGYSLTGTYGEFTLDTSNPTLDTSGYSALTKGVDGSASSFQSFCLERETAIGFGQTLQVVINTSALPGGQGTGGTIGYDPISQGTAYLYKEFATGQLSGYNYTDLTGGARSRAESARDLQITIWALENEVDFDNTGNPVNPLSFINPYYKELLDSEFGDGNGTLTATEFATAKVNNDYSVYEVRALNITDPLDVTDPNRQDQLYYGGPSLLPTPDAGSSLLLLGMALGSIGFFQKRLKK